MSCRTEQLIIVPTYDEKRSAVRLLSEPDTAKLDSAFSVHVPYIYPNPRTEKGRAFAKIMKIKNLRERYMLEWRHNMNIAHLQLELKSKSSSQKGPLYKGANVWTGTDFYFLIIEYKKHLPDGGVTGKQDVGVPVRQLGL